MKSVNEDVKVLYDRIVNGESVYLTQEEVSEIENYALEIGGSEDVLLNTMVSEHIGDNIYKCYI